MTPYEHRYVDASIIAAIDHWLYMFQALKTLNLCLVKLSDTT